VQTDGGGVCDAAPQAGACWSDADCDAGQACAEAFICSCLADCAPSAQGQCVAPQACEMTQQSTLAGVSIAFVGDVCTFTAAEAAAGVTIPYQVVIDAEVAGVTASPQDSGGCGSPGASGLIVFERLSGEDQQYCICDTGLCQGLDTPPATLAPGAWDHDFAWDGVNWTGPSDFGNPKGEPFPPGSYTLRVSAVGAVDDVDYTVEATWPVHITE
ncbi:MAG: hypothetical protein QF464_23395, partial [Myxococcota bacterium]|nr:hypothetical protein [Myxococcota bacterium]